MRYLTRAVFLASTLPAVSVAAQDPVGCWAGTLGAGPTQRRAALELSRAGDGWQGALHVLSRRLDTDSLTEIRLSGNELGFTIPGENGSRVFRTTVSAAGLDGTATRDTLTWQVSFRRAGSEPDPASALIGYWSGALYQGESLVFRMGLEFAPAPCGQVLVTMDSPDQNVEDMPITAIRVAGDSLRFELAYIGGVFRGEIAPGATDLAGEWTQSGTRLTMRFSRSDSAVSFARPQEPRPPFPYVAEDVTYQNANDGTRLAGTITLPPGEGPFPAAVLITGSGAQNRDEALMGHRPFLVIADHLTRQGIAVLRSDDRGVGGSSGSTMRSTIEDNVGDVLAAVELLRTNPRIDPNRIGLIGHSEGGWVAPLAANRSASIAFIVMLAGPAVSGEEILYAQTRAISRASGASEPLIDGGETVSRGIYGIVKSEPDSARASQAILALADSILGTLPQDQAAALDSAWKQPGAAEQFEQALPTMLTPWFRFLLAYDPVGALDSLRVPVLALFGELDLQVPPTQSVPVLETLWADHPDATIRVMPRLNHLFQHAETGLLAEYGVIEETFAPEALELMSSWITERFVRP